MKQLLIASMLGAMFGVASQAAQADTILAFGQDGINQTVNAAAVTSDCSTVIGLTCRTEIQAVSVPITITAIGSLNPVPLNGFLNLDVLASSPLISFGPGVFQEFTGTFAITSQAGGAGINFLSASFVDLVAGLSGAAALSLTASNPPDPLSFTSDVMDVTKFTTPMALSFGFSNLLPGVGSCGGIVRTLCPFESNISGNMSATVAAVPEPASLSLAGLGLLGMAGVLRRRRIA